MSAKILNFADALRATGKTPVLRQQYTRGQRIWVEKYQNEGVFAQYTPEGRAIVLINGVLHTLNQESIQPKALEHHLDNFLEGQ